jgi:hypothetical protein
VTRLVERVARLEPTAGDRVKTAPGSNPIPTFLRHSALRMVPPVPMVLARASAGSGPAVMTSWDGASSQNVSAVVPHVKTTSVTTVGAAASFSAADVSRLADRVVAAIDRRMLAARERLGG